MGGDPKQSRRKTALVALGLFGGLIATAMWGKMRFVTDLPRMAYAVPEEQILESETPQNEAPAPGAETEPAQNADQEREPAEDSDLDVLDPESGGF